MRPAAQEFPEKPLDSVRIPNLHGDEAATKDGKTGTRIFYEGVPVGPLETPVPFLPPWRSSCVRSDQSAAPERP